MEDNIAITMTHTELCKLRLACATIAYDHERDQATFEMWMAIRDKIAKQMDGSR